MQEIVFLFIINDRISVGTFAKARNAPQRLICRIFRTVALLKTGRKMFCAMYHKFLNPYNSFLVHLPKRKNVPILFLLCFS